MQISKIIMFSHLPLSILERLLPVARSRVAIVSLCLEDAVVKKHIISKIGMLVHTEIAILCSNRCNSILCHHSKKELLSFKWDVSQEMHENAPTLLSILQDVTHTRRFGKKL